MPIKKKYKYGYNLHISNVSRIICSKFATIRKCSLHNHRIEIWKHIQNITYHCRFKTRLFYFLIFRSCSHSRFLIVSIFLYFFFFVIAYAWSFFIPLYFAFRYLCSRLLCTYVCKSFLFFFIFPFVYVKERIKENGYVVDGKNKKVEESEAC